MTKFIDGPAQGVILMLKAAPHHLRVTRDTNGKWDALDNPADVPLVTETLYVYELVGEASAYHIRKKGGGGFFSMADYRLCASQPTDQEMRDSGRWWKWYQEH